MLEHELYPEIHKMLMPAVTEAAAVYDGGGINENKIHRMTEHAMSRSGIMRRPPRGHSRQSIYDFTRYLLLCRLLGGCPPVYPSPAFPPVYPPPIPPFYPVSAPASAYHENPAGGTTPPTLG